MWNSNADAESHCLQQFRKENQVQQNLIIMNKYKATDSLHEDIYDFDDIKNDTQESHDSFSINRNGHFVSSDPCVNRTNTIDVTFRLPPIEQTVHRSTPNRNKQPNTRKLPKSMAELTNMEWKTERNNEKVLSRLQQNSGSDLTRSIPRLNTSADGKSKSEGNTNPVDEDDRYRILMQDVIDKKMYEESPQVLDYNKRNNLKHKNLVFPPVPPKDRKPETSIVESSKIRRRSFRINSELEQAVSCHNPSKPCHKPAPPKAEFETNYERDIQEALGVKKELAHFHQALKEHKKTNHQFETESFHSPKAIASNSFLQNQPPPFNVPTSAAPSKTTYYMPMWTSDEAKRALGFKSKARKHQDKSAINVSHISEKVRKQMKKYFK